MTSFHFDNIIDSALENTREAYEKLGKNTSNSILTAVESITLPTTDKHIWSNFFLVKQIFNVMWHVVTMMIGSNRLLLAEIKNTAITSGTISKRWWADHTIGELLKLAEDLPDNKWETIKILIIKKVYAPIRPEAFANFYFTTDKISKVIDVVMNHSSKMDYGSIEKVFRDENELVVAEWLEIIHTYEKNKDNQLDYVKELLSTEYPVMITPVIQDFLRFNHSKKNNSNKAEKENKAKIAVEETTKIAELGPEKAIFCEELPGKKAILVDSAQELKLLQSLTSSTTKNGSNAWFIKLDEFSKNAYMHFTDIPKKCIRVPAQHQMVIREHYQMDNYPLNLRHVIPGSLIDVCGLILSFKTVAVDATIRIVTYDELIKMIVSDSIDAVLYLPFDENLKEYLNVDIIATTYHDIVHGICKQIFLQIDTLKNRIIFEWANHAHENSMVALESLKTLSTKTHVDKSSWDAVLTSYTHKEHFLEEFFPAVKDIPVEKIPQGGKSLWRCLTVPLVLKTPHIKAESDPAFLNYTCQHWLSWSNVVAWKTRYLAESERHRDTPDDDLFTYRMWQKRILDFTVQFSEVTDAGFFICKSCGSILNQRKYLASGSYIDGSFITSYWPLIETIAGLKIGERIPEFLSYFNKRFEELCFYLHVFNLSGADNALRTRKIKEILTWISFYCSSINTPKFIDYRTNMTQIAGLTQYKNVLTQLTDQLLKNPQNSGKISQILATALALLTIDINVDQIQRLPDLPPLKIEHFLKVKELLFKGLKFRVKDKYMNYDDNLAFSYLFYYISGMLVVTQLWDNEDFFFNFIFKKRGRKSNQVEKKPEISFEMHRESLETLIYVWNLMQAPEAWVDAPKNSEIFDYLRNIAIRSAHNYEEINDIKASFFTISKANKTKANNLPAQEFRLPFPGYLLPPLERVHYKYPIQMKTSVPPKFNIGYTVKLQYPSIKCDIKYEPKWAPCRINPRLLSKTTMWKAAINNMEKVTMTPKRIPDLKSTPSLEKIPKSISSTNLFETYTDTYTIDHNHLGDKTSSDTLNADKIHRTTHDVFGDVIYYSNNRLQMQIYYNPLTLQLVGYQNSKEVEPVMKKALLIRNSCPDTLLDSIGIQPRYLNYTTSKDFCIQKILRIAKERVNNIVKVLSKIRTTCFALFVFHRELKDPYLEKLRLTNGICNKNDITIPFRVILSRDYSWVSSFQPGDPLKNVMDNCIQAKQARGMILETLTNIYQKYNHTEITKLKQVLQTVVELSCTISQEQYNFFDIIPLPFDTSDMEISFGPTASTNNETNEDDTDTNFEELEEKAALVDQDEELDILGEELQENRDERENLDALE